LSNPLLWPLVVFAAGCGTGALGALLGVGGGFFLVPFLNLILGMPIKSAAAISLATVIASSSSISAERAGLQLINVRLGLVLESVTVAGSLTGGLTAHFFAETTLQRLFALVAFLGAGVMLARLNRRNVLDPSIDPGRLGMRYQDEETGGVVTYRIKRLPLALAASFAAGNLSSLLGIGGGIIKVPVLNALCGVPVRAAASTSALMIGITATSAAIIYYGRGDLDPLAAAPAILGVQLGSSLGLRVADRAPARGLKSLMAAILVIVGILMLTRGGR
jgi:uncharacterized membrane protein YfcA